MALRMVKSLRIHAVRDTFLALPAANRRWYKCSKHWVVPTAHQCRHVKDGADPGPASPNRPLAPHCATVPVDASHTHQGGDLPPVQGAQLREVNQQG